MATGDLNGSLRKIEQGLRLLNYPRDVDYTVLVKGDPAAFLPIISYCFTSFSTCIAELLVKCEVELTAKSDLRFIEAVYKFLRDQFQYKPILTKEQFLQVGFAERKMQIVCDVINCVVKKHKELSNSSKVKSQTRKKIRPLKFEVWSNCGKGLADPSRSALNSKQHTQKKPLVERHSGNEVSGDLCPLPLPEQGGTEEELCPDYDIVEVKCEQVIEENSQIEFLKNQLADFQEKLHKLDWMEDKLHVLEEKLQGKVIIDEKDWNNLLNRVLLLETELLLQSRKRDFPKDFSNINQKRTSSSIPVSLDTERNEEMPESHLQSSGCSSLLSTDQSPKDMTINSHDLSDISKETIRQRMEKISKIIEETFKLFKTPSPPLAIPAGTGLQTWSLQTYGYQK
ncbi:centrosomal protein of 44 kDa isoform X1 [Haemorhous mexicanus]|uniref:centrosomal protein of 44 kDa isoform X1 n=1 Tax=Haemorhous mexicanus TaxID=30427 RepID=UPI0028BD7BD9|nr:centrosomal protein of 44 kDa isoform X1 [Haemorhous mexicanus]XP_059700529.1 centrosomal protein of 44 kDa isoform X1 [Haemorhous mexicanus]XP_059700530.1 centrosomal protein of 44 kDa isoform X1 [Haemorhous mexicanus]XP_059700531.1 centrosomal protein of 44 kDa isoform X1 [Haemorhous mexicanus]XP_059700533.1 centrosomal protein of 44 kDa isoform X1 [Haemorhous mexicanus]XP_059700534.1 centrosomal protein of 44 kDa isoform X1 [Haemorhous mexicanus]XP_059700535.1 centrosomal protein of 44 